MKHLPIQLLAVLTSILTFSSVSALHFSQSSDAYNHLYEINKEWQHHVTDAPDEQKSFPTDNDRIQYHLNQVVAILSKNTPKGFDQTALKHRQDLLNQLSDYAAKKIFPTNHYHRERTPYFIDNFGVHCAVGYLIAVSGHEELANRIKQEHNYDYIRDIKTDGLAEWASNYGFMVEELKWVQPTYGEPSIHYKAIQNGPTNYTTVWGFEKSANDEILFFGNLWQLGDSVCNGIGKIIGDQCSCYASGVNGSISDLAILPTKAVAVGTFNDSLKNEFPVAIWHNNLWQYSVPQNLKSIFGQSVQKMDSQNVQINMYNSVSKNSSVWNFNVSTLEWTELLRFKGVVKAFESTSYGIVYVGDFTEYSVFENNIWKKAIAKNILIKNDEGFQTFPYDDVSIAINTVVEYNGQLYFGGYGKDRVTSPAIFSYDGIFRSVNIDIGDTANISKLYFHPNGDLLVLGNYRSQWYGLKPEFIDFLSLFSEVKTKTTIQYEETESIVQFYYFVYDIIFTDANVYVGGNFTELKDIFGNHWVNANSLAVGSYTSSINNLKKLNTYKFYPNPVTDIIKIEKATNHSQYRVLSVSGQEILKGEIISNQIGGLDVLVKGIYVVEIQNDNELMSFKIIKE
ncbi:MAG: T9SS type A sorting domain-containing protein [Flavobacteriales bacterium]|nr:T9SS type A sorting domain-containing protein [Flavobacteriales bacterium]